MPTRLLYLNDSYCYEANASVKWSELGLDGRTRVALDQTIFYAKGGGQPCDRGAIEGNRMKFEVLEVVAENGEVIHLIAGKVDLIPGQEVRCTIDSARRRLHSRLHSAGELLCAAMWDMGYKYPLWPVSSAIHYPERSCVEFGNLVNESARETLKRALEVEVNRLIHAGGAVQVVTASDRTAAAELCGYFPDYLPEGHSVRVVTMAGHRGRPCVGTHVSDLKEIGPVTITKIKSGKGRTAVSYALADSGAKET
jgi:Ser-tRNA(Ala) deacylase AlaX